MFVLVPTKSTDGTSLIKIIVPVVVVFVFVVVVVFILGMLLYCRYVVMAQAIRASGIAYSVIRGTQ